MPGSGDRAYAEYGHEDDTEHEKQRTVGKAHEEVARTPADIDHADANRFRGVDERDQSNSRQRNRPEFAHRRRLLRMRPLASPLVVHDAPMRLAGIGHRYRRGPWVLRDLDVDLAFGKIGRHCKGPKRNRR